MSNPPARSELSAVPASETVRLRLPTRTRINLGPDGNGATRYRLAERIAALPRVHTVEDPDGVLPGKVAVYVHAAGAIRQQHERPIPFCDITSSGIGVEGLDDAGRHQVLSRGWGRLENHRMQLFLPRNDGELDVCWRILYCAYCSLLNSPAAPPLARRAPPPELPEFSRTTLC